MNTLRRLVDMKNNSISAEKAKIPEGPVPCICRAIEHITDPLQLITILLQCGFDLLTIISCIPEGIISPEKIIICLLSQHRAG